MGLVIDGISRGTMSRQQLVVWVAVMLGIALLVYGLRYIWRLWLFGASYKLAIQLRQKIYQQLSQQDQVLFTSSYGRSYCAYNQ